MPKDLSPGFSSKNVTAENKLMLSTVNELVNIDGASFASPITFYCGFELGNVLFKTSQANTHFTMNLLGGPGASFSSLMAIGKIRTVTLMITCGASAYSLQNLQIDGATQTVKWAGGSTPTGNVGPAYDVYTFSIIKVGASSYVVLGTMTKFA